MDPSVVQSHAPTSHTLRILVPGMRKWQLSQAQDWRLFCVCEITIFGKVICWKPNVLNGHDTNLFCKHPSMKAIPCGFLSMSGSQLTAVIPCPTIYPYWCQWRGLTTTGPLHSHCGSAPFPKSSAAALDSCIGVTAFMLPFLGDMLVYRSVGSLSRFAPLGLDD